MITVREDNCEEELQATFEMPDFSETDQSCRLAVSELDSWWSNVGISVASTGEVVVDNSIAEASIISVLTSSVQNSSPIEMYVPLLEVDKKDFKSVVPEKITTRMIDGFSRNPKEATYFLMGGFMIKGSLMTVHNDPLFLGGLDVLAANADELVYRGYPVLDLELPSGGYNPIPSAMMQNLSAMLKGEYVPLTGNGDNIYYGARPNANVARIPLIRVRIKTGWHCLLLAPRRVIRVVSDRPAYFEHYMGVLWCVSHNKPRTNFQYSEFEYTELSPPVGSSMIYHINGVDYRCDREPRLQLRAHVHDTITYFKTSQGNVIASYTGNFIDDRVYECTPNAPIRPLDVGAKPYSNEMVAGELKAPRLGAMPEFGGGDKWKHLVLARPTVSCKYYGLAVNGLKYPLSMHMVTRTSYTGFLSTDLGFFFASNPSVVPTVENFYADAVANKRFYKAMRGYSVAYIRDKQHAIAPGVNVHFDSSAWEGTVGDKVEVSKFYRVYFRSTSLGAVCFARCVPNRAVLKRVGKMAFVMECTALPVWLHYVIAYLGICGAIALVELT